MFGDPSGLAPEPIQKGGGTGDVLLGNMYSLDKLMGSYSTSVTPLIEYRTDWTAVTIDRDGLYWKTVEILGVLIEGGSKTTFKKTTLSPLGPVNTFVGSSYAYTSSAASMAAAGPGGGGGGSGSSGNDNGNGTTSSLRAPDMVALEGGLQELSSSVSSIFTSLQEKIEHTINYIIDPNYDSPNSIFVLVDIAGANCLGHAALIIKTESGYYYYSKDGTLEDGKAIIDGVLGQSAHSFVTEKSLDALLERSELLEEGTDDLRYDYMFEIKLSSDANMAQIKEAAFQQTIQLYSVLTNSCIHTPLAALHSAQNKSEMGEYWGGNYYVRIPTLAFVSWYLQNIRYAKFYNL